MTILKKILAPTDFSDLSVRGAAYACQLANKMLGAGGYYLQCCVTVDESNVIDKREMGGEHKQRLDEFVAKNAADVGANRRISRKNMVDAGQAYVDHRQNDCAENERVDLIVMSSHGRSGLPRMPIGSASRTKLCARRPVPCMESFR